MSKRSWYHTLEFPDGTVTPGYYDTRGVPGQVPWPGPLTGLRCLDVGTFDGFWAFEMERRGADEVVAIDIDDPHALDWPYDFRRSGPEEIEKWQSQRGPGFAEASRAMGSSVKRLVCSVYDLNPEEHGTFDLVLCGALLLHLRDPVRALERMREVCRGSLLLIEALDPTLELLTPRVPAARLVPHIDQWWRVNKEGLKEMARKSGFRIEAAGRKFLVPFGSGGSYVKSSRVHSLAAGKPLDRGTLHFALRGVPRPPNDAGQA